MPEDVCFIEISNRRCPGPDAYVLEPDTGGELVRLQQKSSGARAQHWQVIPTFDVSRQFAGVVLYNLELEQALRFAGKREPLQMGVWHADAHDPSYVWAVRPSDNSDFPEECSLLSASREWSYYIDASGDEPCTSALAQAWEWRDNANQHWLLRPAD